MEEIYFKNNNKFNFTQKKIVQSPMSNTITTLAGNSLRGNIIYSLGIKNDLLCVEITRIVRKIRTNGISHQAVYKTLNQMVDETIILKKERKYSINPEWIEKTRNVLMWLEETEQNEKIILI